MDEIVAWGLFALLSGHGYHLAMDRRDGQRRRLKGQCLGKFDQYRREAPALPAVDARLTA
jgi:hypothetical protein